MKNILIFIIAWLTTFSIQAAGYTISQSGKEFTKSYEQCALESYWDSNGYTIGWGHHNKHVYKGMRISQREADRMFNEDVRMVEAALNRLIDNLPYEYRFSQNFIDGFADLIFNCGEGSVRHSEFYRRLQKCRVRHGVMNVHDYEYTLSSVKTMNVKYRGHQKRRHDTYHNMRR